ncbi:Crotonobetainyl-CoA dehydrogenase [Providencia rettgeri]|nr:Crotonobetainyl-CoA dehydrogenase [Providencia rettgeri]
MDFRLNDEQELFVAGIRELMASENWESYFAQCDRDSMYPERFVKALADMEIDNLLIPEEHGGLNAGFITVAAVWMELGRLGAPTYVLYQLPGGLIPYSEKGPKNKLIKLWHFAVQVNKCGTLRLRSPARVLM